MVKLPTFHLPTHVLPTEAHFQLGIDLIAAWREFGIFQVAMSDDQARRTEAALAQSRQFFATPFAQKARCVSDQSFAGYIASGEELTAGEQDYSEIFTVTKDLPQRDPRVQAGWPCHGPVPWPSADYRDRMTDFTDAAGGVGEILLELVAMGLGLEAHTLTDLTRDGWHHMRVLRFPKRSSETQRGIGAHTDYGLLVIAAQDDVGGLYIRPPVEGEVRKRNWLPEESSAGMYQGEDPWTYVAPVPRVFTVFPGDILQFMTNGHLLSTPHKVRLNTRERYALAYFHEPNFQCTVEPVLGPVGDHRIHYGRHFTQMFMRCYPERVTTERILREGRLDLLDELAMMPWASHPHAEPQGWALGSGAFGG